MDRLAAQISHRSTPQRSASPALIDRGQTLATDALGLRGNDAQSFAEQFATLAARPVAVHLAGDGATFRQALCLPVGGSALGDDLQPAIGAPPLLLVELISGHLLGLRLVDCALHRFSLSALLRRIERSLERLPQGLTAWPGIEKSIELMARRCVALIDLALQADAAHFWREYYAPGEAALAKSLCCGLPPMAPARRQQAVAALIDIQSAHYHTAINAFIDGLDGELIESIRASGLSPSVSRYNRYRHAAASAARYRIQAAAAIPLLAYLLGEENHRALRLRRLVDDGQPLWPALADTVGVDEESVRWLRGKTADDIGTAWLGRLPELLRSLARLAPQKRPQSRDEWTAYTDFALVLADVSSVQRHTQWLRDLARLGWIAARQKFAALGAAPSELLEIADLLREISGVVGGELLPQLAGYRQDDDPRWQRVSQATETLFLETSLIKQLRASMHWHQRQWLPPTADHQDDAAAPDPSTATAARLAHWPAPLDAPIRLGGLTAHFLTSSAQLHDEGLHLEHCVGSYAGRCLFDGTTIVSLRQADGRPVSTAELHLVERGLGLGFELVQHKAQRNSRPSTAATQAMAELLCRLAADDLQPRLLEMREQLQQRRALDDNRRRWQAESMLAPNRRHCLTAALKLHVGYQRFLAAGREALEIGAGDLKNAGILLPSRHHD